MVCECLWVVILDLIVDAEREPSLRNNVASGRYVGKHAAIRYVQHSQMP